MDYSAEVRRRFVSPRYAGTLDDTAPGVASGEAEDRALNVWIRFQVEVRNGKLRAARFRAYGCPHTIAVADWAAQWLEGRPVEVLRQWDAREAAAVLRVPVEKLGKLLRLEDAVARCWRALGGAEGRASSSRGSKLDEDGNHGSVIDDERG